MRAAATYRTRAQKPDNPKVGVTRPDYYDPELNPTYAELAQHYGTVILPARPYHARDKAKVEQGVLLAERWILAALRHHTFHTLDELRAAVAVLLERLNTRPMRRLGQSRRECFDALERAALRPLPRQPYECALWKRPKVSIDYHVAFDDHYYSVPYQLVGEVLDLRATATTIELFRAGRRVASHVRRYVKHQHTTDPAHMPAAHRAHRDWSPSRLIAWGATVGPATAALLEELMRQLPACVEDVDYHHPRGLAKAFLLDLSTSHWVAAHQTVILTGATGLGKSYLACALAHKACRDGYTVAYRRLSRLFDELAQARADGTYLTALRRLAKVAVLVLDDFGLEPLGPGERKALLEILEDRYGLGATIITSQLDPKNWHAVIGDETVADAICDRLVHGAHRIKLSGESLRKGLTNGKKPAK